MDWHSHSGMGQAGDCLSSQKDGFYRKQGWVPSPTASAASMQDPFTDPKGRLSSPKDSVR